MALMAPTQAAPSPHDHTDSQRTQIQSSCRNLQTLGHYFRNTCSPPNGPTLTPPGILRPFSVDINKPAAAFH